MMTPKRLAALEAYYKDLESADGRTMLDVDVFARTVWLCYQAVSGFEKLEYVSLWQVREMVLTATGIDPIDPRSWNTNLATMERAVCRDGSPYGLSLEVDATPQERARRRDRALAIVRGCPRWIISMALRRPPTKA